MKQSIGDWLDAFRDDASERGGRNGWVTDSDHSYFQDGLLITTCAFHPVLAAWVPVVYTWIDGQGTEDHRPHFRRLNSSIVTGAGVRFEPKLLSASMISLLKDWSKLSPSAQLEQRRAFVQEASAFLQGCEIHFWRSAKRLQKNGALIPPETIDMFEELLRELLSPVGTEEDFEASLQTLRLEFPRIKNWISWWVQPLVARMIFPAKKTMSEADARSLPRTSNAVETQHSLCKNDGVGALLGSYPLGTLVRARIWARRTRRDGGG
ncbi:hypothetical protein C2E23DRAFT_737971 [Lenzites betulinus]|nr:hypothetical protein C2E23DRAFT_737971 [Lenzites betulinus]